MKLHRSTRLVTIDRSAKYKICVVQTRDGSVSKQELEKEATEDTYTRQTPAQQRNTSHNRQSPSQTAAHASNQHTTHTSHRTLCHRSTTHRHSGTTSTAGATGIRAAHIQLKPRHRGNAPTPVMTNNVTNDFSTSVLIGDLSSWRHLTACSPG